MKKQKTANVGNVIVSPRDIWKLPDNSESYIIKAVSNTRIDACTLGDWTNYFNMGVTEFWPVFFSKRGWEFYLDRGLEKVGVLDSSIMI